MITEPRLLSFFIFSFYYFFLGRGTQGIQNPNIGNCLLVLNTKIFSENPSNSHRLHRQRIPPGGGDT